MIGSGGHFGLRGLEYLLIAAVDELGNFSADQVPRVGENLHTVVAIFLDRRRDIVLLQKHATLSARRFDQIKTMIAQPLHGVFKCAFLYLGCHFTPKSGSWLLALG